MLQELLIDKNRTTVLIMDYQNEMVQMLPEEQGKTLLQRVGKVLEASRGAGLQVVYVVVRFREGYPEVSPRNRAFSGVKSAGGLREGTKGAEIHSDLTPKPGEVVIAKRRVGAFSSTELETVLRAGGKTTLVLLGLSTSGVMLSTVRRAADMDYELVVLSDGCADRDEELHRVLIQKLFPKQASVITAEEFVGRLKKSA